MVGCAFIQFQVSDTNISGCLVFLNGSDTNISGCLVFLNVGSSL